MSNDSDSTRDGNISSVTNTESDNDDVKEKRSKKRPTLAVIKSKRLNQLEKERRGRLGDAYQRLHEAVKNCGFPIPAKKASQRAIMSEAIICVKYMNNRKTRQEQELNEIRRRNARMEHQLAILRKRL